MDGTNSLAAAATAAYLVATAAFRLLLLLFLLPPPPFLLLLLLLFLLLPLVVVLQQLYFDVGTFSDEDVGRSTEAPHSSANERVNAGKMLVYIVDETQINTSLSVSIATVEHARN
jgi:hypothetical protein